MRIHELLLEAKPENLNQDTVEKLFPAYQKKDSRDTAHKLRSGLEVADIIYRAVGPDFLIWTALRYIQDPHLFLHDLPDLSELLRGYQELSRNRTLLLKSVSKYQSVDELRKAYNDAIQKLREKEGKQNQLQEQGLFAQAVPIVKKFAAQGSAEILYDSPQYIIYRPLKHESTKFLEKLLDQKTHTNMICTIKSSNLFEQYIQEGTLLFTISNDNKVYAGLIPNNSEPPEFNDSNNNHSYDLSWQVSHFPALKSIVKKFITKISNIKIRLALEDDPAKQKQICRAAVQQTGRALYDVPKEFLDQEMCLTAVKQNGGALRLVPKEFLDRKMCLTAVQQFGGALQYVPKEFLDRKMCLTAVQQFGGALYYVPDELRDREMCLTAVKQFGEILDAVPWKLRDRKMCLTAVKQNGRALYYVPDELRDREMCLIAVKQYGQILDAVPDELRDREMCLIAVKQYGQILDAVPWKLRDRKMCLTAVSNDMWALQYVPDELLDREMCLTAVQQFGGELQYVPEEIRYIIDQVLRLN